MGEVINMPEVADSELEALLSGREGKFYLADRLERVLPKIAQRWSEWKGKYAKCIVRTELRIVEEGLRLEREGYRVVWLDDKPLHMMERSRILHQVWVQGGASLPENYQRNRELWRAALPDGWTMMLWDDAMARARWSDYAAVADQCYHHATRADLILARCSRDFGGLNVGTDSVPANAADMLHFIESNETALVLTSHRDELSNGLVWSARPGHPFFACVCLHQLRQNAKHVANKNVPWATGPGCYYQAFRAHSWDLNLVTLKRGFTHDWADKTRTRNGAAWVDPGYAASWWGERKS